MKGLQDYRFKLVWASSFMGVKAFEQFFYAIGGHLYIRHFGVWAVFKGGVCARVVLGCWDGRGGGLTESCRSCKVFCASCLRLIGLLGLKTELNQGT